MHSIRTILFDLDNTLVNRQAAWERYCRELVNKHFAGFAAPQQAEIIREMIIRDNLGDCNHARLFEWLVNQIPDSPLSVQELFGTFRQHLAQLVQPDEAVVTMVRRLASRFRLGVVTNGSGENQRTKLDRAGLAPWLSHVFVSGELGMKKPQPAIFQYALEQLQSPSTETLFVGDNPRHDIAGAAAVGLHTCWVTLERRYPDGLIRPDMQVNQITDVWDVLG